MGLKVKGVLERTKWKNEIPKQMMGEKPQKKKYRLHYAAS